MDDRDHSEVLFGYSSLKDDIKNYNKKQLILDELEKTPEMLLATAYLYAKSFTTYGIDVTKAWTTAVQQTANLERVYRKGYSDAQKEIADQYAHFMEMNFPKEENNVTKDN